MRFSFVIYELFPQEKDHFGSLETGCLPRTPPWLLPPEYSPIVMMAKFASEVSSSSSSSDDLTLGYLF